MVVIVSGGSLGCSLAPFTWQPDLIYPRAEDTEKTEPSVQLVHNGPNRSLHLNCRIASQRLQDNSLSLISPCKTRKPCEHTFLVWEKIALLKIGTSLLIPTPSPIHFVFAFTERYSGCVSLMVSYNIMNGVL